MWIKKTQKEIDAANSDSSIFSTAYLMIFILCFVGQLCIALYHGENTRLIPGLPSKPYTWIETMENVPRYFMFSVVVTVFIFFIVSLSERDTERIKPRICLKCNKKHDDYKIKKCLCGGDLISIDKMKWIDE